MQHVLEQELAGRPKHFSVAFATVAIAVAISWTASAQVRYEPTWESLDSRSTPQWWMDAKFGIYTHWGIYSVSAHGGPDYVKGLYYADEKKDVFVVKLCKVFPIHRIALFLERHVHRNIR